MIRADELAKYASQSFALPDTCHKIRALLDDPAADAADIADIIALDPSLSSKLLRLANSALFRFPAQVNSLSKAVNVIGGEALYNLALAETAASAFRHFENEAINLKRFWQQSVYAGLLAKQLAKMNKARGSDEYFVMGLLHQLAELVVATRFPDLASECQRYVAGQLPWQRQQEVLGFTYAQCSAQILENWQLPVQFAYTIAHVHDEVKAKSGNDLAIGHLAVRLALHMVDNRYCLDDLLSPAAVKKLKLDHEDIQDAIKFTKMDAMKLLSVMNPDLF
ncbi:HDOD domain-containing protein [Aliiglaciecola sp. CAU 1673]|uniref:HDOD domain-containing protein n=1 Tax=Aliiglaciecola sp. CAU 1673 TaxID=3032595 RepID=UPI0023D9D682|nr:HDOD domain-containing protein [Aliiglaciecola sp. CAU 1673]MDF2179524.1 HDOD domain-containing protein [Aliiglaciecola sp. CAU 1673]